MRGAESRQKQGTRWGWRYSSCHTRDRLTFPDRGILASLIDNHSSSSSSTFTLTLRIVILLVGFLTGLAGLACPLT